MVKLTFLRGLPLLVFLANFALARKTIKITRKFKNSCVQKAKAGDQVMIFYSGYKDNEEKTILAAMKQEKTPVPELNNKWPLTIKLGHGMVIKGLDQGIQGMCAGEEREIWIPSHLAYDEKEEGKGDENGLNPLAIPRALESAELKKGENVIFRVELLSIQDKHRRVWTRQDEAMQQQIREITTKPVQQQKPSEDDKFMEELEEKLKNMEVEDDGEDDPLDDAEFAKIAELLKDMNFEEDDNEEPGNVRDEF